MTIENLKAIEAAVYADYGMVIDRHNARYRATTSAYSHFAALLKVAEAAKALGAETSGAWTVFESEIRQIIGNTNYNCMARREAELHGALAELEAIR